MDNLLWCHGDRWVAIHRGPMNQLSIIHNGDNNNLFDGKEQPINTLAQTLSRAIYGNNTHTETIKQWLTSTWKHTIIHQASTSDDKLLTVCLDENMQPFTHITDSTQWVWVDEDKREPVTGRDALIRTFLDAGCSKGEAVYSLSTLKVFYNIDLPAR